MVLWVCCFGFGGVTWVGVTGLGFWVDGFWVGVVLLLVCVF